MLFFPVHDGVVRQRSVYFLIYLICIILLNINIFWFIVMFIFFLFMCLFLNCVYNMYVVTHKLVLAGL